MAYQLRSTRRASKELRKLPDEFQQRIREAILDLADDPRPPGCKKLEGRDDYRIQVGNYRVLYEIDADDQVIIIWRVGHRRDVYRDL